jgi:hypothetical protein
MSKLIGLVGYGTSGKDEIGAILTREHGFTRLAFADHLKAVALELGWSGRKDDAGRRFLQDVGMSRRELFGADYWLRRVFDVYDPNKDTVITDVRLPNEIDAIRERGGFLWHVTRPGVGPANDHITEHAWCAYPPDATIDNSGSLDDLAARVRASLASLTASLPSTAE